MLMDPKKLSSLIREKKKKLLTSDPDVVTSEPATMNAQDVEDTKQLGRIESTLNVPEKSNSDEANLNMSESDAQTIGLTSAEKKRMARLRAFFDTMILND